MVEFVVWLSGGRPCLIEKNFLLDKIGEIDFGNQNPVGSGAIDFDTEFGYVTE
jgi:hypothetical protein